MSWDDLEMCLRAQRWHADRQGHWTVVFTRMVRAQRVLSLCLWDGRPYGHIMYAYESHDGQIGHCPVGHVAYEARLMTRYFDPYLMEELL